MNKISDMSESHLIFSGEQPRQDGVEISPTVGGGKIVLQLGKQLKNEQFGFGNREDGIKYDMVKKKTKLNEGYDLNAFPNPR